MHAAALRESLHRAGYIADEALATTLWLAGELQLPLLIEVDAGVGHRPWPALAGWADGQSERVKTGFRNLWPTPQGVHRWAEAEPVNPLLVRVFGTLRATQRHACGEAEAPFFASADDLLQRIHLPERLTFVRFLVTGLRDTVSAANRSAHVDLGTTTCSRRMQTCRRCQAS